MTDKKKLIEEARRAKQAVYLATDASVADDLSRIIGGLADALEAAEKAHTPTDDEREALATILGEPVRGTLALADRILAAGFRRTQAPTDDEREALMSAIDPSSRRTVVASRAADRVTAAGFHRSATATDDERADAEQRWPIPWNYEAGDPEHTLLIAQRQAYMLGRSDARTRSGVPEPSAEEPECFAEKPDWPEHWTSNDKLRDLHARWHEQKGNLIGRDECGYERCEFWDAAEFTLRLADVRIAGREPQGEPSDAQVRSIWDALGPSVTVHLDFEDLRAALRAAGGVR